MNTSLSSDPAGARAMRIRPVSDRWQPTIATYRTTVAAIVLTAVALVFRRPDLLVIATPFAVVSAWSMLTRPTHQPLVTDQLGHSTIREGEATTWRFDVESHGEVDAISVTSDQAAWFERKPHRGSLTSAAADGSASVRFELRSLRWGRYVLDPLRIIAVSPWAAFRFTTKLSSKTITSLPLPAMFDSSAPIRPTDGLVGAYRSIRPGEGSEFAGLRDFQVGDRMRRINWSRSLRSDGLQVNATFADQDTHVSLVVDSMTDIGVSGGVDGAASSLDTSVRAAGAIAEHYGQRGNRVSLQSLDASSRLSVPPGTGAAHVRRILDTLARVNQPGGRYAAWGSPHSRSSVEMTVVLSPLLTSEALDRAVRLGRLGRPVVVVDTLPDDVAGDDDPLTELAWRIRLLERRRELRVVQEFGVAVVKWRGAGSLDQFLRDAVQRTSAPRVRS